MFKSLNFSKSIWAIGVVAALVNLSGVIIFSLSPLYLTTVLGVTRLSVGYIEGGVEFLSWLTRVSAGIFSDSLRKRKPLLVLAVGLMCVARPLFAVANTIIYFFTAKSLDRIANGLQASPRDALIGDLSAKNSKGKAYGLRQSFGTLGSAIGAIIAFLILSKGLYNFSDIFLLAAIPPFFAFLILCIFVKDKKETKVIKKRTKFNFKQIKTLDTDYWKVLIISFTFMLSNYSGSFIILHGTDVTNLNTISPAIMIVQNIFAMLAAYPVGKLFDKFNHRILIIGGFLMTVFANIIFANATSLIGILCGAAFWGIQVGANQSLLNAKIAITTVKENRGTAFGIYYITIGVAILLSNTIMGNIAYYFGPAKGFIGSAVLAMIAISLIRLIKKE